MLFFRQIYDHIHSGQAFDPHHDRDNDAGAEENGYKPAGDEVRQTSCRRKVSY